MCYKAKPPAAMQNMAILPVKQHWNSFALLRHLSLVLANPPTAGLVTHRRTVQVYGREVMEPRVHHNLSTTK